MAPDPQLLLAAAAVPPLLIGAANDVATRTLPDRAAIATALLGAVARALEGATPLLLSLGAALLVFALCWMAWRRGWMGGGDVKLLPAATLLVAAAEVPALLFWVALSGGALALCYLALPRLLPASPPAIAGRGAGVGARIWALESRRLRRGGPLPYGVAIAAGALLAAFGVGAAPGAGA